MISLIGGFIDKLGLIGVNDIIGKNRCNWCIFSNILLVKHMRL